MLRLFMAKANCLLQKSLIQILRGYQFFISPLLGKRCRFHPSCSHYAIEALREYQVLKALCLILWRIVRCHPFHPGGYDPLIKTSISKVKENVR
jgi:putative membrane protein insertion efficiency factor